MTNRSERILFYSKQIFISPINKNKSNYQIVTEECDLILLPPPQTNIQLWSVSTKVTEVENVT